MLLAKLNWPPSVTAFEHDLHTEAQRYADDGLLHGDDESRRPRRVRRPGGEGTSGRDDQRNAAGDYETDPRRHERGAERGGPP